MVKLHTFGRGPIADSPSSFTLLAFGRFRVTPLPSPLCRATCGAKFVTLLKLFQDHVGMHAENFEKPQILGCNCFRTCWKVPDGKG